MMKKNIFLLAATFALLLSNGANSQQLPGMDFLYGYTNDAKLMLTEYVRPYANILGANLNAGWYNTARPHKLGGVDITVTANVAFAPASALSYDLSSLDLEYTDIENGTFAPTIAGKSESRPNIVSYYEMENPVSGNIEKYELSNLAHPDGLGLEFLPLANAQLTVGLMKGTDVSVRFVPTTRLRDYGRFGLWGIGGKHSISQWIPVLKRLNFIDISLQGGYTKVNTLANLNMEPKAEILLDNPPAWNDQFLELGISGWTVNVIASQSIPIVTFYQGIGYSSSLAEITMTGHYPINMIYTEPDEDFGKTTYAVVEDPIKKGELEFENYKNLRLNAGVRFKLGVLTLHYDFTRTLYSTHSAGIGISFR